MQTVLNIATVGTMKMGTSNMNWNGGNNFAIGLSDIIMS